MAAERQTLHPNDFLRRVYDSSLTQLLEQDGVTVLAEYGTLGKRVGDQSTFKLERGVILEAKEGYQGLHLGKPVDYFFGTKDGDNMMLRFGAGTVPDEFYSNGDKVHKTQEALWRVVGDRINGGEFSVWNGGVDYMFDRDFNGVNLPKQVEISQAGIDASALIIVGALVSAPEVLRARERVDCMRRERIAAQERVDPYRYKLINSVFGNGQYPQGLRVT